MFGPTAQPLTVSFGQQTWQLARVDLLQMISLHSRQAGHPVSLEIDDAALRAWVASIAKEIDEPVQEPPFHFSRGSVHITRASQTRASQQGRSMDEDAGVHVVHDALLAGRPMWTCRYRSPIRASSEDPRALGITELMQTAGTSFLGSVPERKHNIHLAAQRLNGIVVPPRATFSFNDSVGPTTLDVGFQWGYGIESGNHWPRTVRSVAGGICRVATTFFQPVFWGGYQLEDRYGHLYRIPEYTSHRVVGLDATVDEDADLDFKWTNTTSNYVLIQGDSDKGNVYFSLYGKKPDWNVKVDDAVITNKTPPDPTPSAQPEPMLPWGKTVLVETARDGFDAEIKRHIIPSDASQERVPDLTSHDEPAQTVTLVGTGGVPSSANVDAAIDRALAAQNTPAPVAKPMQHRLLSRWP